MTKQELIDEIRQLLRTGVWNHRMLRRKEDALANMSLLEEKKDEKSSKDPHQ